MAAVAADRAFARSGILPPDVIQIVDVQGLPEIAPGDDLAALTLAALHRASQELRSGDVVVFTSKVVSKVEGRTIALAAVTPSVFARSWAAEHGKDPRQVEVVLREARRIVRMDRGLLLAETRHGFICANAGVDHSNAGGDDRLVLLPVDPDASARRLREALRAHAGPSVTDVAVVISDTFGRPWRVGQTNIAIGAAGIEAIRAYAGERDPTGLTLVTTSIAVVDELAAAAELVMHKLDRVPVALIRGYAYRPASAETEHEGASALVRQAPFDLFR